MGKIKTGKIKVDMPEMESYHPTSWVVPQELQMKTAEKGKQLRIGVPKDICRAPACPL